MSNVQLGYTQVIDPISFKSIPSGKIYIGEYGTLPNPANAGTWKQAYFVNSDGTRTAASQPIATNAAGYSVDGSGNIKTVQVDGQYSIVVQNSLGATKFSLANVSDIWSDLASSDPAKGASLVEYGDRSVKEHLDILSGAYVFATDPQFAGGATGDGATDDLASLNAWASYCYTNGRAAYWPAGNYAVSGTFEFPHNVLLSGAGPKRTKIIPHSSFIPGSPTFLMKVKQNPGAPAADNNFLCDWSGFGIYANHTVNLGCLSFAAGGGSRLNDMYIVDGGANADQVSFAPVVADGLGALVAQKFSNVWFGTTTFSPTCKNGVVIDNAYSMHFDSCIFDYMAVTAPSGANGYAIKLLNSVGVVFTAINCEGNTAPFYIDNSSNTQLVGGAIYRKGLGQAPSTDADFCFTLANNENEMPNILGTRIFQGYGLNGGSGGVAKTVAGVPLNVARSTNGELNYFNTRALQFNGGAQFGNTARADLKTLDWYEETDFAANISVAGATTPGTVNVTTKLGFATRIGNKVIANITVAYDTLAGAAGDLVITGLPWNAKNTAGYRAYATIRASNLTFTNTLLAYVAAGESQVRLYQMASGSSNTAVALDADGTVSLSLIYDV